MAMKKQILKIIYSAFDSWSAQFDLACRKGCPICCTQDVSITAPEGELLFDFIIKEFGPERLLKKLDGNLLHWPLSQTTNEYAKACLAGKEIAIKEERRGGVCPFLDNNVCSVYEARPFSCRCFASTRVCSSNTNALLPSEHLSAATAVSQIIEHLGQFSLWGNMLDILYLQAAASSTMKIDDNEQENIKRARSNCLKAQPLPGFLIEEGVAERVIPLLEQIFETRVGSKTVEDILNNR